MPMERFTHWEEFVSEIAVHAPSHHAVHLTFSVRYHRGSGDELTLLAWCETRRSWIVFADDLTRASDEDDSRFALRAESLLRERKRQLERAGFVVSPGRTLVRATAEDQRS
jgi:hypothetical protein